MIKKLLIVALMFPFLAFAALKIDASSVDAFDKSQTEILNSLSGKKKLNFQDAVYLVATKSFELANGDEDQALNIIKAKLHGKTADQVIKENPISPEERLVLRALLDEFYEE